MGLFGKSKEDTSQDAQIKKILQWIETRDKHIDIMVKNNNAFIKNENSQRQFNQKVTDAINSLIAKDQQHDTADKEIRATIQAIKNMGKQLEEATQT